MPASPTELPAQSRRRRILIADDNVDAAECLATLLRLVGHDVRVAHDGSQALTEAAAYLPEVAFLDIGMPRIDGYEVARRLRAETWAKSLVLVAVSGWGTEEDKRRAFDAGFDYHFTKPADIRALEGVIRTCE